MIEPGIELGFVGIIFILDVKFRQLLLPLRLGLCFGLVERQITGLREHIVFGVFNGSIGKSYFHFDNFIFSGLIIQVQSGSLSLNLPGSFEESFPIKSAHMSRRLTQFSIDIHRYLALGIIRLNVLRIGGYKTFESLFIKHLYCCSSYIAALT